MSILDQSNSCRSYEKTTSSETLYLDVGRVLGRVLRWAVGLFQHETRSNRKVGNLKGLSDRELKDLGLSRSDLHLAHDLPFAAGRLPDPHNLVHSRQVDFEQVRSVPHQ